jgi:hypothetical protein
VVAESQQIAEDAVVVGGDQDAGVLCRQHCRIAVVEPRSRERERLRQLARELADGFRIVCRAVPDLGRGATHPSMI